MIHFHSKNASPALEPSKKQVLKLDDYIAQRDYVGAIAFLEFCRENDTKIDDLDHWLAFAAFHTGDYRRARGEYDNLLKRDHHDGRIYVYLACCYFMLGNYEQAEQTALKAPESSLQTRLLFHIAHKQNHQDKFQHYQNQLQDDVQNQMCLASMKYMKHEYHQALNIYKRYLLKNRDYLALNVYVSLCYYKLDYFDMSQELLDIYLKKYPDSVTAVNIQACNQYKLYNRKRAENDLKQLLDNVNISFHHAKEIFQHNMTVFQDDPDAFRVFNELIDVIPEARYNLAIYHLKQDNCEQAFELMKNVEPNDAIEYILQGIVHANYGQKHRSHEHIKQAQTYFQTIGSSPLECDTIPGRQCMAAYHFLHQRFYDVLVYLSSIKVTSFAHNTLFTDHLHSFQAYFPNDDTFNFNYAQAKGSEQKWHEAEEALLLIARCHIQNNKPHLAWELYLKFDRSKNPLSFLELIANDCYKHRYYLYSACAFHRLQQIDPNPLYRNGKQGACAGCFQQIIVGRESRSKLHDLLPLLRNSQYPEEDQMLTVIRSWAKRNNAGI
ncbi:unnamed protein product [Adineta ricciae]|uniref:Uncharacterized protein n=1 Tax=Adineta ricciae TaxID=249248 RepID=A0A814TTR7_ADIRI|nr:unnamed protein product [Adineta ricciae]